MQGQRQYALKQNFMKIEFEYSVGRLSFCVVYRTSKLLPCYPYKHKKKLWWIWKNKIIYFSITPHILRPEAI